MANSNSSTGIGFGTILFVVFLILKLCNVIDWSWLWVTAPLWIPFGLLIAILLIAFILAPKAALDGFWKGLKS